MIEISKCVAYYNKRTSLTSVFSGVVSCLNVLRWLLNISKSGLKNSLWGVLQLQSQSFVASEIMEPQRKDVSFSTKVQLSDIDARSPDPWPIHSFIIPYLFDCKPRLIKFYFRRFMRFIIKGSLRDTHPCRSPTPTTNGHDLTIPTRTENSEQEYSDLTTINRRPSTHRCRNTPQSFSRGTRSYAFSRWTKHM